MSSSTAGDIVTPGPPETIAVSDGVYAYIQPDGTWWINNTGFLTGPQGVISIDACSTRRRTEAYQRAIAAVTPAPVRAVVNTHHHGDHTFGNCLFPAAAIIAQERARAEAIAFGPPRELPFWDGPDWGELTLEPPFITFTDRLALHAGDLRAEVRHAGTPAHTTNDSIVWIPERSVLFSGDLIFNGGTPFLMMGSVAGAIEVLEQVIAPARRPDDRARARAGFRRHRADRAHPGLPAVRATHRGGGRAAGLTPLRAATETDLGPYAAWPDAERIVGNLHRAYAELDGAPPGAPIDVVAALAEMVTGTAASPCLPRLTRPPGPAGLRPSPARRRRGWTGRSPTGRPAGQHGHHRCHVRGLADPAQRGDPGDRRPGALVRVVLPPHLGVGGPWQHRVHCDAARPQLVRRHPAEQFERGLAGRVRCHPGPASTVSMVEMFDDPAVVAHPPRGPLDQGERSCRG